jgi:TnpA family transposase
MPRLKGRGTQQLNRPEAGRAGDYPHLQAILTRPITWDAVRQQYDETIK